MRSIRITETSFVRDERVVILNDVVFSDFPPFAGTFLFLGPLDLRWKELSSGRRVVTVVCHWEESGNGDDFMNLMTSDQTIKIVDRYTGPVVSRIGCLGCGVTGTFGGAWFRKISMLIPIRIRRLYGG